MQVRLPVVAGNGSGGAELVAEELRRAVAEVDVRDPADVDPAELDHARLAGLMLARDCLPPEVEVLVGSSARMTCWGCW